MVTTLPNLTPQKILTVSQLNRETSHVLAEHFFSVWVQGEISNLATPASGHVYFSLKDSQAQIRCALFVIQRRRLTFKLENGQHIVVRGQVSLYEPRGDYQLIVDHIEPVGEGELRRIFELLKLKLLQQGLFDAAHKRPIPALPKRMGVITSPTGAAIRDILTVLRRRFPAVPVIIYPTAVQGIRAKYEIVAALAAANQHCHCDALILARGGGSLEDLNAFNEEMVVQAIFTSKIPVITGVGHETDVTLADFVADLRAATPSAAAEHAVPDQQTWLAKFVSLEARLQHLLQRKVAQHHLLVMRLGKHLQSQHPRQKLLANAQRVDDLDARLSRAIRAKLQHHANTMASQTARLWQYAPSNRIDSYKQQQDYLQQRLTQAMHRTLTLRKQKLLVASQTLHTLSPLATLSRGYAIVSHCATGALIRSTEQLKVGDRITTRIAQGQFTSQIKDISHD